MPITIPYEEYTILSYDEKCRNTYLITDVPATTVRHRKHGLIYIHKSNCPNCGGLLDGDEHSPYVKCGYCGTKIWSEREVS